MELKTDGVNHHEYLNADIIKSSTIHQNTESNQSLKPHNISKPTQHQHAHSVGTPSSLLQSSFRSFALASSSSKSIEMSDTMPKSSNAEIDSDNANESFRGVNDENTRSIRPIQYDQYLQDLSTMSLDEQKLYTMKLFNDANGQLLHELQTLRDLLTKTELTNHLNMCSSVIEGNSSDVWSAFESSEVGDPLTDIQVILGDRGEQVPESYTLLHHSCGGRDADINRRVGGRTIYFCYSRDPTFGAPITALSLVYDDLNEEPPLGFEKITTSVTGFAADLNFGNGGHRTFLCIQREQGPSIRDIALVFSSQHEQAPNGFHILRKTSSAEDASLNGSRDDDTVYLAFHIGLHDYVNAFAEGSNSEHKFWRQGLAVFMCSLYASDVSVVMQSLRCIDQLVLLPQGLHYWIGQQLLDTLVQSICNALLVAHSQLPKQLQTLALNLLFNLFRRYMYQLSLATLIRICESCFSCSINGRNNNTSIRICDFLFTELHVEENTNTLCNSDQSSLHSILKSSLEGTNHQRKTKQSIDINSWISSDLLPSLVDAIVLTRSTDRGVNQFQRARQLNSCFRCELADTLAQLTPNNVLQRALFSHLLVSCKVASEPAPTHTSGRSQVFQRKQHALCIVRKILEHSIVIGMFRSDQRAQLILRRHVCTCVLEACVTVVPSTFQLVLSVLTTLWTHYRTVLKTELGVILDAVLLPMLESRHCWPEQKIDLIDAVSRLFDTPLSLVELFYNFDNEVHRRNVFTRLLRSLCQLAEHHHHHHHHQQQRHNNNNIYSNGAIIPINNGAAPLINSSLQTKSTATTWKSTLASTPSISSLTGIITQQQPSSSLSSSSLSASASSSTTTSSSSSATVTTSSSATTMNSNASPSLPISSSSSSSSSSSTPPPPLNATSHLSHSKSSPCFLSSVPTMNSMQVDSLLQRVSLASIVNFVELLASFLTEKHQDSNNACTNRRTTLSRSTSISTVPIQQQETFRSLMTTQSRSRAADFTHKAPISLSTCIKSKSPHNASSPLSSLASPSTCGGLSSEQSRLRHRSHSMDIATHDINECKVSSIEVRSPDHISQNIALETRLRASTWVERHIQQKRNDLLHAEALALAHTESIKACVHMLVRSRGVFIPEEIAQFLYTQSSLDKQEIGEYLACESDRVLDVYRFIELRQAFLSLIDFTSMDLDSALRHYLVHSSFRLPGEAQKVDRLIQAFAEAYTRDNPGVLPSEEATYLIAFALIMLNTDIHDPRLRSGRHPRAPMTKSQFIRNLQSADSSRTISTHMLGLLFDGIAARAIEWQSGSSSSVNMTPVSHYASVTSTTSTSEKAFRNECELLVRRGLGFMKTESVRLRPFLTTPSRHIVHGMFEVMYPGLLVALTSILDRSSDDIVDEHDADVRSACVDGLKFACVIAISMCMHEVLEAFTAVLAKITYLETNACLLDESQLKRNLLSGQHLMQEWTSDLKVLLENKRINKAIGVVVKVANRTKQRLLHKQEQQVLQSIQDELAGEIHIVHPERVFVRDGHLTKISSSGKLQVYRFFLFNDMLLYARESFQKLKPHKVFHLSLCRLSDVLDRTESKPILRHAFRIRSPQKSFIVVAPSAVEKESWMISIQQSIDATLNRQRQWVETARQSLVELDSMSDPSSELETVSSSNLTSSSLNGDESRDLSRILTNFIGRGRALQGVKAQRVCYMCTREYSLMRRKCVCSWCSHIVCTNCCQRRIALPINATVGVDSEDSAVTMVNDGALEVSTSTSSERVSPTKPQRVCDACFGLLSGSFNEDEPPILYE